MVQMVVKEFKECFTKWNAVSGSNESLIFTGFNLGIIKKKKCHAS